MRVLKSPETAVHLVTLLEEMPVQETADGIAELRAAGLPVGAVIVNMVRPHAPRRGRAAHAAGRRGARPSPRRCRGRARRRAPRRAAERLVDPLLEQAARARRAGAAGARAARRAGRAGPAAVRTAPARRGRRPGGPVPTGRTRSCGSRGRHERRTEPRRRERSGADHVDLDSSPRRVLDVDPLLDDPGTRIIVCCGSGGVGKTTTAAALGVRAAERGRKVVVLTIDPARRLAQSMGIDSLDNTPRRVKGVDGRAANCTP